MCGSEKVGVVKINQNSRTEFQESKLKSSVKCLVHEQHIIKVSMVDLRLRGPLIYKRKSGQRLWKEVNITHWK